MVGRSGLRMTALVSSSSARSRQAGSRQPQPYQAPRHLQRDLALLRQRLQPLLAGATGRRGEAAFGDPVDNRRPPSPLCRLQGWFSPPKISDTELSSNTARIALARIVATESTLSLLVTGPSGSGSVSVMATVLIGEDSSRSRA